MLALDSEVQKLSAANALLGNCSSSLSQETIVPKERMPRKSNFRNLELYESLLYILIMILEF